MANSADRRQTARSDVDPRLFQDQPLPVKGWIVAHCDGGSRGNPGPSGFGVLVEDQNGVVLAELSEFLGKRTNNYAEYSALLAALNFAVEQGHPRLRVVSDSELMVKQIKGQYRVNSPELKPLHEEARHRIALLEGFEIQHVLREKNRKADGLANLAMDRGMGRPGADAEPGATRLAASAAKPGANRVNTSPGAPGTSEGTAQQPLIPIHRPQSGAAQPKVAEPIDPAQGTKHRRVRGFVKGGVVHLLDGENLSEGTFVTIVVGE